MTNNYSYVFNAHPTFIEDMYKKYQQDANSVEEGWRVFFQGFDFQDNSTLDSIMQSNGQSNGELTASGQSLIKELGVLSIINGFRSRGHLLSTTNPIRNRIDRKPHLKISDYGLEDSDMNKVFSAGLEIDLPHSTLTQIIDRLHQVYAGNIGFQYLHMEDRVKRLWFREKAEKRTLEDDFGLPLETKKQILKKLNDAVVFEQFLHTKYVGQKRFSLEGGESTIVALDTIITDAAKDIVQEVVIGMAHRGRLNVLANVLQKTYENLFSEFEGTAVPDLAFGDGDVKYHLGFSSLVEVEDKKIHLKLVPNPSHLESVDPVVQGFARAKADLLYDSEYDNILPILIHGDAAVAGQGVVYETAQMSELDGYSTGGTIHFVINNQIGFTTDFGDARTSTYSTAAALAIGAPVFHVNGDDPEAVAYVAKLAIEYRQKFNTDVFIDMVCYRKHGHNEGDDPSFTQPAMYELIKNHKNPRELYVDKLTARGDLQKELAKELETTFWEDLQNRLDDVKQHNKPYEYQEPELAWKDLKKAAFVADKAISPPTGIDAKLVNKMMDHLLTIPDDFTPLGKVKRLIKGKEKLLAKKEYDWAMGEWLAFGSILLENRNIRISGQDVKRGTFSHRHAILNDIKTYEEYNRFNSFTDNQGKLRIYNSLLSEFAVMGFEYGYSLATPTDLVVWEAQFGDFYNGAQTIVDQYLSAAESKWGRMSGLVLLLPHGYAGQGPEHSSARVERFLQSCAEFNMIVANITTPANLFHALRRQVSWDFRKPLVIMSPKSLLRHSLCVSKMEDFTGKSKFQELIDDASATAKSVKRLLFCSGKIYYDLYQKRAELKKEKEIAIVRLEQLYPFPKKQVEKVLTKYKAAKEVFWVQEEPKNMGPWAHVMGRMRRSNIEVICRKSSASPATGYKKIHDEQQAEIVNKALT